MFFGIMNSLATFQGIMNEIMRDLINEGKVAVFVDNVLVSTNGEEGYDEIVAKVLKRLKENDLYVKLKKCSWKTNKVNFLRVVIGQEKIEMEKDKIVRVLNWLTPRTIRDVRKFLGLTNYYRRFIKNFVALTKPLNMLTRKDEKWR